MARRLWKSDCGRLDAGVAGKAAVLAPQPIGVISVLGTGTDSVDSSQSRNSGSNMLHREVKFKLNEFQV